MPSTDYMAKQEDWSSKEVQIYKAQYAGTPWRYMNVNEKDISLSALIIKIGVITGVNIPDNQMVIQLLEGELVQLIENDKAYSSLTVEEILTAFRMNSANKLSKKVEHYNNVFNLAYFCDVINQYLESRAEVRAKAELTAQKLLPMITEDKKLQWEEICEACYQQFLTSKGNFLLWPVELYDVCTKNNFISRDLYESHMTAARVILTEPYHIEIAKTQSQDKADNIGKYFEGIIAEYRKEENQDVVNVAKKLSVAQLFEEAKKRGYAKLFLQEEEN